MRILKLSYEHPPIGGGGAKVVAGLARELAVEGYAIDLVTMAFRRLPRFETTNGYRVNRIPCIRLQEAVCHPAEMASYLLSAIPVLEKLSLNNRFELNHTHFIFPDGLLAYWLKKRSGLAYIITAHGSDVPGYNPDRFITLHRLLKPIWNLVTSQAALIVSPSHYLEKLVHLQNPNLPTLVIPNGFDPKRLSVQSKDHKPGILVVSRMFERKGIQYLLQSLVGFPREIEVNIVGDGPYRPTLEQLASRIKTNVKIHFHGWIDNDSKLLRELMQAANIFVFPSEVENFPVVLLEAMSAGLAVITTQDTGCSEVIGDCGMLVKPRDPISIREALFSLVDDPALCSTLGKAAQARVEAEFAWPVVVRRYKEAYAQVLKLNGG